MLFGYSPRTCDHIEIVSLSSLSISSSVKIEHFCIFQYDLSLDIVSTDDAFASEKASLVKNAVDDCLTDLSLPNSKNMYLL